MRKVRRSGRLSSRVALFAALSISSHAKSAPPLSPHFPPFFPRAPGPAETGSPVLSHTQNRSHPRPLPITTCNREPADPEGPRTGRPRDDPTGTRGMRPRIHPPKRCASLIFDSRFKSVQIEPVYQTRLRPHRSHHFPGNPLPKPSYNPPLKPCHSRALCESKSVVSTTVSSARKVVRVPYFLRVLSTIDHSGTLGHGVRVF